MIDLCFNIRVSPYANKVKRSKRKVTSSIVFHRISVGRDVDECVKWFLHSPEGVATSTVLPEKISETIKQWNTSGIPARNLELAFVPYNFMIEKSGEIVSTLDIDGIGAHCAGVNSTSIGVGIVEDLRERPPTASQWDACRYIVHYLRAVYEKNLEVYTHDEIRISQKKPAKNCTGSMFQVDRLRRDTMASDA